MAAISTSTSDVRHLQVLVEKLQNEKASTEDLARRLTEEVRELTKELALLKKENLTLKAAQPSSTPDVKTASTQYQPSNSNSLSSNEENTVDSKLSGQ